MLQRASIDADLVFGRLWQSTGCRDVIAALLAESGFDFDVERAIYLTVLHRLMVSGSDRHASRWREVLRIPGVEKSHPRPGLQGHALTWRGHCWVGAWDRGTTHD
jgi:hypothetical protein